MQDGSNGGDGGRVMAMMAVMAVRGMAAGDGKVGVDAFVYVVVERPLNAHQSINRLVSRSVVTCCHQSDSSSH